MIDDAHGFATYWVKQVQVQANILAVMVDDVPIYMATFG